MQTTGATAQHRSKGRATGADTLIGQVGADQIAEWKKGNPDGIFMITADGKVGYFKNPDRHIINCCLSKATGDAPLYMYEELAELTWLGGCEDLLQQDDLFLGVINELKVKLAGKTASLVNL
jgi:hypothetical protein